MSTKPRKPKGLECEGKLIATPSEAKFNSKWRRYAMIQEFVTDNPYNLDILSDWCARMAAWMRANKERQHDR